MIFHRILPRVIPITMFSEKFRDHHKRLCKWCELLAGVFVGIETHLVPLAVICCVWVLLDAIVLFQDLE